MLKDGVRRRAAGMIALGMGGLVAAATAPAAALAKDAGSYRVQLAPMVILDPVERHAAGEERAIKAGDVLLKAPLGWADTANIAEGVKVTIAGVADEIAAGTMLHEASATGGDLGTLGDAARVYCAPEKANLGKSLAAAMTLGLTAIGSRVAKATRLCLVDTEGDARFDKSFLVGLKKAGDRKMVAIEPLAYEAVRNAPIGVGSHVEVVYHDGALLVGPNFQVQVFLAGAPQVIDAIHTGDLEGKALRTKWQSSIKRDKMPQPITIGPAQFTVTGLDQQTKAAKIRYDRDLAVTPVMLQYRPQTIYVYVPG